MATVHADTFVMRRCFLHVGTHRTGTTAVQVALARNADALRALGICVPSVGKMGHTGGNHNVALELGRSDRFDPTRGTFAEMLAVISGSGCDRAIVSSEIFQQLHAKPDGLRIFVDGLRSIGFDTRVIVYLRSQGSYAESVYAAYVKMGFVVPFSQVIGDILRDGALGAGTSDVFELTYSKLLAGFADVIGRERVIARAYHARAPRSMFDDLLDVVGVPAEQRAPLAPDDRQNVSFTAPQIAEALGRDALAIPAIEPGSILLADEAEALFLRFEADNRDVFREYGVSLERAIPDEDDRSGERRAVIDGLVRSRNEPPTSGGPSNGASETVAMIDEAERVVINLAAALAAERGRLDDLRTARSVVAGSRFAKLSAFSSAVRDLVRAPAVAPAVPRERKLDTKWSEPLDSDRKSHDRAYARWRAKNVPKPARLRAMATLAAKFDYQPKISIVMATYNTPPAHLLAAIDSVRAQVYPNWELCIADDASPQSYVRDLLFAAAATDARIVTSFREVNGNISEAGNSALAVATGEFVGFLDHDDLLAPEALFEVVAALQDDPDTDMFYSDEDKLSEDGTLCEPHFKPDWCPDSFLSRNYTSHFSVFRRSIVEAIGGLRKAYDGSQDFDLTLRFVEKTHRIRHLPAILYHWRRHDDSTAKRPASKPYAFEAARSAIAETIDRRGEPGSVTIVPNVPGAYLVRYRLRAKGRVSVIVPTRDHADDVDRCLTSIFERDEYGDFEVVIVDNGSTEPSALATFANWKSADSRVRVERYDVPFNFSAINNFAVDRTTSPYLLFLNNDTEVISHDWLTALVEQAQRPTIGAVGARLLYADETIQHAGVILGVGGVAGHSHKYFPRHAHGYFMHLDGINNYSAVTGACLMVRRSVFEQAGRFDERLAVAFNDVDLCLRIGALGYRNVALPHVCLYHHESRSRGAETTPEQQTRFAAEIALMKERWKTDRVPDPCYSPHLNVVTEDFAIG